ncbi:MAG: hypothetical protein PHQ12_05765, partial [Chthoniobacteraceae bacterium]|nr:hypothetical protein [Chthoniobacteraceae bacterium]
MNSPLRTWTTPLVLGASIALAANLNAAVTLPAVLNSHMVLQRDMPVPIWGTADPNEKVTVQFRGQQKTATADAQGKWMVKLDPLKVGEPGTLTVTGNNTVTLTDVLVGEVWLGSGQSNIDSPVNMYTGNDPVLKEAAAKSYPNLRLFRAPNAKNGWTETKPDRVGGFSAQLFYFGMKLQGELGVPVGLVEAAVAGSPSGPFLSQAAFDADPDIQKALAKADADEPIEARMKKYEETMAKWQKDADAARAAGTPENKLPWHPSMPKPYSQIKTGDRYEKLIRPLIPFAIRGVLWDQGEGGAVGKPIWQPMTMAALIRSWRADWGQGEFPWLYVQKPSGGGCALDPANPVNAGAMPFVPLPKDPPASDYFSGLRHEGYAVMKNPNTFLVINSDLAPGVHPPTKSGYGTRDLQVALG